MKRKRCLRASIVSTVGNGLAVGIAGNGLSLGIDVRATLHELVVGTDQPLATLSVIYSRENIIP